MPRFFHCLPPLLLAGVFLFAGVPKLIAPLAFADNIHAYGLLPTSWISPLALTLPSFEILTALALLFRRTRNLAYGICLSLCLIFLAALTFALTRGLDIECGCFGVGSLTGTPALILAIIKNLFLIALALLGFKHYRNSRA